MIHTVSARFLSGPFSARVDIIRGEALRVAKGPEGYKAAESRLSQGLPDALKRDCISRVLNGLS